MDIDVMRLNFYPYLDHKSFRELRKSLPKAKRFYSERRHPKTDKSLGVGANTARAFRGINKPSQIYRHWARATLNSARFERRLLAVRSRADFERFHQSLCRSIAARWYKKTGQELSLAHRYKLIDLFIKRACCLELKSPRMNKNLLKYGHIPIDSRVFAALDRLFSRVFVSDGRAMGNIKTEQAYQFYQELIRRVMRELREPPLYFDYYAWNIGRKER